MTMFFEVKDTYGFLIYEGESWPMARAALDFVLLRDQDGCPSLEIWPKKQEKE